MIEVRCKNCNKLLMLANLLDGAIKCHKCYKVLEYKVFNNMFVTTQYDPTNEKVLRPDNDNANIELESERP